MKDQHVLNVTDWVTIFHLFKVVACHLHQVLIHMTCVCITQNFLHVLFLFLGGDGPEAVADALHQVLKLNWRQTATKICIFISDAPPHGLGMDSGDGFPNGKQRINLTCEHDNRVFFIMIKFIHLYHCLK